MIQRSLDRYAADGSGLHVVSLKESSVPIGQCGLLTQVVDAAVSLSHAEEGLLLLPDEEDQTLLIRAAKGLDTETARNFRIKTQDSLAGTVYRSGRPVLVGDQGPQKVKTEYLVKSLLYVPLSIKGEIIGVLGVNNKYTDRTFSQHDLELLQDLAAHAAIAIENLTGVAESFDAFSSKPERERQAERWKKWFVDKNWLEIEAELVGRLQSSDRDVVRRAAVALGLKDVVCAGLVVMENRALPLAGERHPLE